MIISSKGPGSARSLSAGRQLRGFCLFCFVCIGTGYCIQCGSSNSLGFIGYSLKPKVLGVCNAPSTNGSYGYIGIGGGNLLTLPTPVVKPNTTPAVI